MATLELKKYDLYGNGTVENFVNGEQYLIRDLIIYEGNEEDRFHTVMETDTVTYLAWLYYKDMIDNAPKYWWVIADANELENPMDLGEYIGRELLIPDINRFLLNQ
jgi:hypothetical protein